MTEFWIGRLILSIFLTFSLILSGQAAEKETKPAASKPASGKTAVQRLGGAGPWNAYVYKEKGARVCYMAVGAQKSQPAKFKRKAPAAMVTHRPEENVANVVSFVEGYPLKEGSTPHSRSTAPISNCSPTRIRPGRGHQSSTRQSSKRWPKATSDPQGDAAKGSADTDSLFLSGFAQTLA